MVETQNKPSYADTVADKNGSKKSVGATSSEEVKLTGTSSNFKETVDELKKQMASMMLFQQNIQAQLNTIVEVITKQVGQSSILGKPPGKPHKEPHESDYNRADRAGGDMEDYGYEDAAERRKGKMPYAELPRFNGKNPRSWIEMCEEYFNIYSAIKFSERLAYIRVYLEGDADIWFRSLKYNKPTDWNDFVDALINRFEMSNAGNSLDAFMCLKQGNHETLEDLLSRYDSLASSVMVSYPEFEENFYLEKFVGCLQSELRSAVQSRGPRTLRAAIAVAKQQEFTVNSMINKISATAFLKLAPQQGHREVTDGQPTLELKNPNLQLKKRFLTDAEMKERVDKKLCFKCGDPFAPGHQCSTKLYAIQAEPDYSTEISNDLKNPAAGQVEEDEQWVRINYPNFDPWGQGSKNGGGNVMARDSIGI